MSAKQIAKTFCFIYFSIYGLTVIVTFFWCLACGDTAIPISFFWQIMLFSLVADAPIIVFWSRKELTAKQTVARIIIHGVLLEALLLPAGWLIGMWHGVGGFFAFFATVLLVDVSVYAILFLKISFDAVNINTMLRERKNKITKKEDEDYDFEQDNRDNKSE